MEAFATEFTNLRYLSEEDFVSPTEKTVCDRSNTRAAALDAYFKEAAAFVAAMVAAREVTQ